MTITRSLLSKLHLPYKQLGIEGSRGDQLYLPDDVGVNLSVLHGVNNDSMVPITTDKYGDLSTRLEGYPSTKRGASVITLFEPTTVIANGVSTDIDVSEYGQIYILAHFISINGDANTMSVVFNTKDNHGNYFGQAIFPNVNPPDLQSLVMGGIPTIPLVGDILQVQWLLTPGVTNATFGLDAIVC